MKKLLLSASIIFLFAGAIKAQMPLTLGHQWTKAFPATNYQTEQAASVVTPDGHLVSVTNYRYNIDVDPNPDSTVVVTGASSFYSGVISIMDSNENYQAHLNFANTQETKIVDIATDSDNNIYALGYTSANISIGTVNPITLTITSASYFLVKLSTNGNPLWAYKTTAKLNTITVGDVNGSERLFVGGYAFKGTNTDIKNASGAGLFNSGSNGVAYPIMVSYDTACNYVSFNYINLQNNFSSPYGEINSITLKNNNLYLAGQFSEIFSISSIGVNITSKGGDDGFVAKYNAATLQPIWAKRVGSHAQDYIKTIDVDNNENVYLSGEFSGGGFNFDPVATG
ncbi:MAG: hypothetical protein IT237_06480, partial [Bacteroidia bacterium]|nr:hypothetical protein [Bacteroidia bacterium]